MPGNNAPGGRKCPKARELTKPATTTKKRKGEVLYYDEEGYPIYEVVKVVDARKTMTGVWEYRVRWKNYGPEDDTWQPEADIKAGNTPELWKEAKRLRNLKDKNVQPEVIDLYTNSSDTESEHEEKAGSKIGADELDNGRDGVTLRSHPAASSNSGASTSSKENIKKRPKVNRDVWHERDQEQVTFRAVQRINVHDDDARQRVTEARENGTPVCLTGHKGWAQFTKRWLRLKSMPDAPSEATTRSSRATTPSSEAKQEPNIKSIKVETALSFGAPSKFVGSGISGGESLSDESDTRSTTPPNTCIQDRYVPIQPSDTSTTQCEVLSASTKSSEEEWLDLTLDWEVDVQKMTDHIGMHNVPILKKGYDEYDPIKSEIPCADFLKKCWPFPGERNKTTRRLYLHQWQFPCTEAKSKLCYDNCHNPIPYNIFGEDLLVHDEEDRVNMLQFIFMGREETVSNMHRDLGGLDISIAPIVGAKEAIMVHRSDGVCISHLEAKLDKINLHQHPLLPYGRIYKTVVLPGEILLMPQGTYHGCRNVTPCLLYSRFILDSVNLRAFVESMWDCDAPEIGHERVIWNSSSDLMKEIDDYLKNLTERQNQSSIGPATTMVGPAEMVRRVDALCALRNICRAISLRIEKGLVLPGGAMTYPLKEWYNLLKDIDSTLHDFRYHNSLWKPPFRFRGTNRASGNTSLKSSLEIALEKLPAVVEASDCIPQRLSFVVESKVEAKFHGRRVEGVIKRIELAKMTALLAFEGFPPVYNEYQPFEALRASVAGEACTEIPPGDITPGKVVILTINKQVCY
jgi:hypothetical protein